MKTIDSTHFLLEVSIQKDIAHKDYPFNLPVVKNLSNIIFNPKVTFFVGENGSGKSTLLEAIAISLGFNAEGGSRNFQFSTKETHSDLHEYLKLKKGLTLPKDGFFFRAETFYNVSTEVDNLGYSDSSIYGGKSLHNQSRGESFLSLIENRFKGNGLYILDEPESALSPKNQLKLLVLIDELIKKNSQFIIATHSPILLGYPSADIYHIDEKSIQQVAYEDTEHYQLTKHFLNSRDKTLSNLLQE